MLLIVKPLPQKEGDDRFRKWEYWGYKSYFILHYTDNHTVYKAFPHRSLKQASRPFIHLDLSKIQFITDILTTAVIGFMKGEITKLSYIEIKS